MHLNRSEPPRSTRPALPSDGRGAAIPRRALAGLLGTCMAPLAAAPVASPSESAFPWWLVVFAGSLAGSALGSWWVHRRSPRATPEPDGPPPTEASAPAIPGPLMPMPETDWAWRATAEGGLSQLVAPSGLDAPHHAWALQQSHASPPPAWWQVFGVADGAVQHQRLMADGRLTLDSCSATGPGGQPLNWRLTLAWVGGPQPVMGRARDISAEVQARQREALLLNGLALSEDPLLVFKAPWQPGQAVEWQVAHLNPAALARWRIEDAPQPGMSAQAALQGQQELPVQAVMEVLQAPLAEHTLRLEQDEPWRIDLRRMALDGEAVAIVVYRRMRPAVPATDPAESLRAEDALRDLESFSYTISHDLRAPIRVVEGFARIVKEDYGAQMDRIGQDHLDRILGASARMTAMIDAILSLSKLSSRPLMRQPVSISQLAGYVVDDLRRQHPDRAARVDIAPGLVVQGDPTLLRMLLDNLLGNAWKYSGLKPQVTIEVGMREEDGRQVYFVRDEGAGFDMRFADRLFGVFQRLHSSSDFEGTGIGLATVQRIVRRHGGQIWAEGQVGQGACFHFTLNETRAPQG